METLRRRVVSSIYEKRRRRIIIVEYHRHDHVVLESPWVFQKIDGDGLIADSTDIEKRTVIWAVESHKIVIPQLHMGSYDLLLKQVGSLSRLESAIVERVSSRY